MHTFVQECFDFSQDESREQDRQDGTLVTDFRDFESEDIPERHFARSQDSWISVGIDKIRVDHQHPQNSSQVRVTAEFLRCAETDQDRQEDISGVGECVDHRCKPFDSRISFNQ